MDASTSDRDGSGDGSGDGLDGFRAYRTTADRDLRNALVEEHMGLAEPFVRRYVGRGLAEDDLRQHALVALVKAVERFDPDRGFAFSTFAGRTIDGELKRYLRDRSWAVRPPRGAQELSLQVRRGEEELTHGLGRAPSVRELAAHLDLSIDDVLTAREAAVARAATSIDAPRGETGRSHAEGLAAPTGGERSYEQVEATLVVGDLLAGLPDRERTVLEMRFGQRLGQPEIAERLGLSQSYVSRLIKRTLDQLRDQLDEP